MRRREFIGRSVGIAAAAGAARPQTGSAGQFAGKIKKAVKFHMVAKEASDLSVEDKFRLVKDTGFDGIEVRTQSGEGDMEILGKMAAASERLQFPIHGVIHSSNPDLKLAIDQAHRLGGTSVLHVVRYDRSVPYLQNYRETQEIIRRATDHAAKRNVMILVENVWASFLIEPMSMARYLDEIDSPIVGAYFDIGNVVRWGWPQHWIEVLGHRIKKLDVKEFDVHIAMNEGMRKGFGMPLGSGSIDWQKVRQELAQLHFEGWATAEVPGGGRDRLAEIAQQMNQVLDLQAD